jgi:hypothetical protein
MEVDGVSNEEVCWRVNTVTGVDEELMTVMRDRGGEGVSNEEVG